MTNKTDQQPPQPETLDDLAARIKSEHQQILINTKYDLLRKIRIGEDLNKAKAMEGHGNWLTWVETNCAMTDKTAKRYMNLATNKPTLVAKLEADGKIESLSDLSIAWAERLIAEVEATTGGNTGSGTPGSGTPPPTGKPKAKPKPSKVFTSYLELTAQALMEFDSYGYAEEYANKGHARLDTALAQLAADMNAQNEANAA